MGRPLRVRVSLELPLREAEALHFMMREEIIAAARKLRVDARSEASELLRIALVRGLDRYRVRIEK